MLDCKAWGGGSWLRGDRKLTFQGPPLQGTPQTFCICYSVDFYLWYSPSLCWVGLISRHPSHSCQAPYFFLPTEQLWLQALSSLGK